MSNKIYIPDYTPQKYPCVVYADNYITAYYRYPQSNQIIGFDRFYHKSHYDSIQGSQQFGNTNINLQCLPSSQLTNDFYYRHDLDSILIIVVILMIVCFYFPFSLFMKLFKRRL